MKLEITRYDFEMINGQPKIVISMVKVMEDDGTYIKFAKLKEIMPYLSGHPVTFKPKEVNSRELPRTDINEPPF